jgi:hypothetical protein
MDPPGKCAPIGTVAVAVGKPWHDDGRHRSHSTRGVAGLDDEELADWRAGRDAVYQLAALTIARG